MQIEASVWKMSYLFKLMDTSLDAVRLLLLLYFGGQCIVFLHLNCTKTQNFKMGCQDSKAGGHHSGVHLILSYK